MKAIGDKIAFERERDAYVRLREHDVDLIGEFNVPRLLGFDSILQVVEMKIVEPPYLLDFAGAYVDYRPDYTPEIWDNWRREKQEQFGDRWPRVQLALYKLEQYGIFLADVNPRNIDFAD